MSQAKLLALICVLGALTLGAHWLALSKSPADRTADRSADQTADPPYRYFPAPAATGLIRVLGASRLAADFYWLGFIQYAGDPARRRQDHFQLADEYLNAVTQLDPHFIQPYAFAAFTVGADANRPDLAAELIERGIKENPGNWYLPYLAGINQFLYANNDQSAARYYALAASLPGAPQYIGEQAGILASGAPSFLSRARTLESVSAHEKDPLVREQILRQAITAWQEVLRRAPNQAYRQAAQDALARLASPAVSN